MTAALFAAQTDALTGLVTFYTNEAARLVDEQAAAAAVCEHLAIVCDAAADITDATDAIWELRRGAIESAAASYAAVCQPTLHERLQALQFNGVEIDLELVRFYLFGREVLVSSNL